ncbi:ComF family protein [Candidatus Nomurabacteria bacterium]|nr:ComF family protein [Candidatus Nomurabacteria bacterium]
MSFSSVIGKLTDLAFPEVCHFCGKWKCDSDIEYLCKKCAGSIPIRSRRLRVHRCLEENLRVKMSVPVSENFDVIAACFYEDPIRQALIRMKFYNEAFHYREFARILSTVLVDDNREWDMILPVPLHTKRERERGYNQTLLIAGELSKIMGIELQDNIVYRVRNTARQSEAGDKGGRIANLHGAFNCSRADNLKGKRILILDDVLTSGITMFNTVESIRVALRGHENKSPDNHSTEITGVVIASDRKTITY